MSSKQHEDHRYIQALLDNNSLVIKEVYERFSDTISKLIQKNNGNENDARDMFQEALLVFIKKLQTPNFELTAQPKTYLYAVCRNLWLKQLQKTQNRLLKKDFKPSTACGRGFSFKSLIFEKH